VRVVEGAGVCGGRKVQVSVVFGVVVRDGWWVQVHVLTGGCRYVRWMNVMVGAGV
jgi:hypothetical protein